MEIFRRKDFTEESQERDIFGSDVIPKGKIMQISYAYFKPQQGCPKHDHYDLHEVFVCDKGSIDIYVDDVKHEINPGDIVIVRPHHSHELMNKNDITCEMLCIGIACPDTP